ncbi:hypothetical protein [Erythrobacter sp. SD-21]|uniref:hypothetical protein n=1 Tax=Erythrobacter sp. SD-21 TaxID=161528 RepID=UPI000153F4FC|nr:hypothetical protein [Erythrobacter sp. SD-21]EDL47869.1 hypothetical protein ED21_22208 [Erythrobacter sp. SD-21]
MSPLIRKPPIRSLLVAACCVALSACGEQAETPQGTEENLDARGEVLGGTISDDMLPLDTVTSQSPSQAGGAGETGGEAASPAEPAAAAEPAEETPPAAAEEPAPEDDTSGE